jgi:hypothetical protein
MTCRRPLLAPEDVHRSAKKEQAGMPALPGSVVYFLAFSIAAAI